MLVENRMKVRSSQNFSGVLQHLLMQMWTCFKKENNIRKVTQNGSIPLVWHNPEALRFHIDLKRLYLHPVKN